MPYSIYLSLSYFTRHNAFKGHPCCHKGRIPFFLMAEYYSIVYIFIYTTSSEVLFLWFKNGQLGR